MWQKNRVMSSQQNRGTATQPLDAKATGQLGNAALSVNMIDQVQGTVPQNEQDELLDLVNKVQMFKIATQKVNHRLDVKGKKQVFDLATEQQEEDLKYP